MYDPSNITALWEKLIITQGDGQIISPGRVTITGHKRVYGWDIKEASGQDGATVTRKGKPIVKPITASFYLVDDQYEGSDFAEWESFEGVLTEAMEQDPPLALQTYHPDLHRNDLTQLLVQSIGEMILDGLGGATIAIEFIEYAPPKRKTGSGSPKSDSSTDPRIQAAEDELDQAIAEGEDL